MLLFGELNEVEVLVFLDISIVDDDDGRSFAHLCAELFVVLRLDLDQGVRFGDAFSAASLRAPLDVGVQIEDDAPVAGQLLRHCRLARPWQAPHDETELEQICCGSLRLWSCLLYHNNILLI